MGIANVIPGVSGGTIALITGIFERLIDAIKSFNITALKLLLRGRVIAFVRYTDLIFLIGIFIGIVLAVIFIARLFDYLFTHYPVYIWSFFFGLILASIYYVGKRITHLSVSTVIAGVSGLIIAAMITFISPGSENEGFLYLMLCGVVAICSMILPGLSGSFVLIIMGNYQLVAIDAINQARFEVLTPVIIGAIGGLILFSHLLSWVFKKYRNQTIALLTGFIAGSLGVLWPWKEPITQTFGAKEKIVAYDWLLPAIDKSFFFALLFILLGIAVIWLMEVVSSPKQKPGKQAS